MMRACKACKILVEVDGGLKGAIASIHVAPGKSEVCPGSREPVLPRKMRAK